MRDIACGACPQYHHPRSGPGLSRFDSANLMALDSGNLYGRHLRLSNLNHSDISASNLLPDIGICRTSSPQPQPSTSTTASGFRLRPSIRASDLDSQTLQISFRSRVGLGTSRRLRRQSRLFKPQVNLNFNYPASPYSPLYRSH